MRQVGFDQVHTVTPTLLDDGRVVYTRWDYNDRGQVWGATSFPDESRWNRAGGILRNEQLVPDNGSAYPSDSRYT